jgi:hypothetical protein
MGNHFQHLAGSTTQMVASVINLTSPLAKCLLKKSKQLHTQGSYSTHKGTWENAFVIQHDFQVELRNNT